VLFTLHAAHFCAGLVWWGFREVGRSVRSGWAAGVMALSVLIYLPALLLVLSRGDRYVSASTPLWETITRGFGEFTLTPLWRAYVAQMEPIGYVVLPLVVIWLLLRRRRGLRRDSQVPSLCALLLVGSAFLNIFVFKATSSTPFRPPYAIYLLPLMLILSAAAFQAVCDATDRWRWRNLSRLALALAASGLILWTGHSAWQFKQWNRNADWRGLALSLQDQYAGDHVLLFDSVTKLGSWEPTFYGFPRYYSGRSSRVALTAVVNSASVLTASTREPVFILFAYPRYTLTLNSRYPVMDAPRTSVPVDLRSLEADPRLHVQRFIGFYVLRLARPEGQLADDSLSIIEMLIDALPRQSCVVELHLAAASLRCALNRPQWQSHLESAESLAGPEWRDKVTQIASIMRSRRCPVPPEGHGEDGHPGP